MENNKEISMKYFYNDIVNCLIKYIKVPYDDARRILESSHIYTTEKDSDNTEVDDILGHELPYFWAMLIYYKDTNPKWDDDPKLWPPPVEEMNKWYSDDLPR